MIPAANEKDWVKYVFIVAIALLFIPVGIVFVLLGLIYAMGKYWFEMGMREFGDKSNQQ